MNRRIFRALAIVVGLIFTLYLALGHSVSGGDFLIMPLDDTYIHFQYARMTAEGFLFRYSAVDSATSGATSLIYPFLLALGYKIGFQGTALALWAIGIGWLAWLISACLVWHLLVYMNPERRILAFIITLAFAFSGGLAWAALSGMETALIVCLTLYALDRAVRQDFRGVILGGLLCAVTRPEGAIIALCALVYVLLPLIPRLKPRAKLKDGNNNFEFSPVFQRRVFGVTLIISAIALQPLLNFLLTGTFTASGMQAKSYLYNIPFDLKTAISAVLTNFLRMWLELLTGTDRDVVLYFIPVLLLLGLIGCFFTKMRRPALLLFFVIAGNFALLSILETAFWQFKRYQQPVIALCFVALGWWLCTLRQRRIASALAGLTLLFSLITCALFAMYYRDNVREVASLQVPMARYVNSITTSNDRIAVHDIGVMAYIGDRRVYDVVGLATRDAAQSWRTGPGAVYEAMRNSTQRPDYVAIYDEPHGLSYFKNTPVFKNTLQSFPSTNAPHIVASASANQIVAKIDWSGANAADQIYQSISDGFTLTDQLNVADLENEHHHKYQFQSADLTGYASEVFDQSTLNSDVHFMDGGRRLNSETFTIKSQLNQDLLWKIRVHPRNTAHLTLYVDDQRVGQLVQPGDLGGRWLEIATIIPAKFIKNTETRLHIQAESGEIYQPYYHWFYQSETPYNPGISPQLPPQNVEFSPGVRLLGTQATRTGNQLTIETEWQTIPDIARTDGKIFVHVYEDINQPPVAQYDTRAGNGALPPANWLPGILRERYVLTLPDATKDYKLAIGLYNPENNTRYPIIKNGVVSQEDRLFIEIK